MNNFTMYTKSLLEFWLNLQINLWEVNVLTILNIPTYVNSTFLYYLDSTLYSRRNILLFQCIQLVHIVLFIPKFCMFNDIMNSSFPISILKKLC